MPATELLASKADGKRTHPSGDHWVDYLRLQAVPHLSSVAAPAVSWLSRKSHPCPGDYRAFGRDIRAGENLGAAGARLHLQVAKLLIFGHALLPFPSLYALLSVAGHYPAYWWCPLGWRKKI